MDWAILKIISLVIVDVYNAILTDLGLARFDLQLDLRKSQA